MGSLIQMEEDDEQPARYKPPSYGGKTAQTWKTYYVCTHINCGWSGSSKGRHSDRTHCPYVPSPMRYQVGVKPSSLVESFLARCTEAQRRLGLPPDGERAILMSEDSVAAPIPEGCGPGDVFEVLIDRDRRLDVTVPEQVDGRAPVAGDVLQVKFPPKRKEKPSDVKRRQQRAGLWEETRQRARRFPDDEEPQAPQLLEHHT